MPTAFSIIGAIGLVLITIGIILRNREYEDVLYAVGGLCLLVYSIYIDDMIFIVLQIIFIAAAVYDFSRLHWFEN